MKFSFSWLKRHFETSQSIETIQTRLTSLGLEVDSIHSPGDALKDFKVAHIVSIARHPDADKLQVCQVDVGEDALIQVVCGAANAKANLKVVLGAPGTVVPNGNFTLKVSTIRGVESFGMLCSESELGLKADSHGIMELPADAPIGQSIVDYLQLNDAIIDIGLTPNRSDCLGIRGIARDLTAAGLGTLKPLNTPSIKESFPCPIPLTLDFNGGTQSACPHFRGRLIQGVKNGPSPLWLQQLMQSVGLKSISALVDVTNFFSQDLCRPLHVFDAKSIKGPVTVRLAKNGETLGALDGVTYTLTDQMTVVADNEKILALGGIMGSLESGCTLETTDVFLEAAYFDPIRTAQTGRKLGIHSDARYRFERGIDPQSTGPGLDLATQMILDLCGGEASSVVEAGKALKNQHTIELPYGMVKDLTGVDLPVSSITPILTSLGCQILNETNTAITVETPSWRHDLKIPQDLVEEVLRLVGYDTIPLLPLPPINTYTFAPLTLSQQRIARVRSLLANRHMMEAITWSMVDTKTFQLFGGTHETLRIVNPITTDLEWMRPSLLPQLLFALKRNLSRGITPLNLFEVGPTYQGIQPEDQKSVAGGVRVGLLNGNHWTKEERPYDIFDVKQDALAVLGMPSVQISQTNIPNWMHPYRSGLLMQGPKNILGYFGEMHPSILKTFGIKVPVMAFEVFLSSLPMPKAKPTNKGAVILSSFQPVEKDLAFIVDQNVPSEALVAVAKKAGQPLLTTIGVFDVYVGANVTDGKKSIAIRFHLQPIDATLTDGDIHGVFNRIINAVEKELGGILRDGK